MVQGLRLALLLPHFRAIRFDCHCIVTDSDIIYLQLPMQPTIVLGTAQAAIDLFEKRSHLYSDRILPLVVKLYVVDYRLPCTSVD